jgi:hypothetical protein
MKNRIIGLGENNSPLVLFFLFCLSILYLNFNEKLAKSQKIFSAEEAICRALAQTGKSLLRCAQKSKNAKEKSGKLSS